ncbi:hypothetical protein Acr_09g0005930 [Actinidia rufa]|uniref:Uncharacterized protein n=1 Tax=Actinidia rufa TaxID=165716 RepID=A0A7J0F890_9ERIC|nr:hypothetical protein Acr_09g0005930 [Actinidia rufa]
MEGVSGVGGGWGKGGWVGAVAATGVEGSYRGEGCGFGARACKDGGWASCSSRRYGAPAPNRVRNGVRTRPHAPFEDRQVRSVSATRQGRSHALPRARGKTHAPTRAREEAARAATREEECPRALTRRAEAITRSHAPSHAGKGESRAAHAPSRGTRAWPCARPHTAATAVMADEDESAVLLAASDNGKSDWGYSFDASGGILRVSKGNKEMLWGKKTRGLYRLEGNVQTGGATVRHGSSGISKENGQGKQPLHRGTQSKRRGTWRIRSSTRAQGDALGYVRKFGQTRVMQPVQDVHREAQRKETKSILKSCTAKGTATPKRVSFALDLISGGVLSSCAHKGGEMEPRQLAK